MGTNTGGDIVFSPDGKLARIAMSDDGDTLFIIDPDTTANHGGIFASTVHCDGTLSAATRVTDTFVARALVPLANGD